MKRFMVVDDDRYEQVATIEEALKSAKTDIGPDGWEPCTKLYVVEIKAVVTIPRGKPSVRIL